MAYVPPTPADLQKRFPAFSSVDTDIVQAALDDAARMVDETWTEGDFGMGRMLYACHVMTLDGFGVNADQAGALGQFKSLTSGSLSITYPDREAKDGLLGSTTYGVRFIDLMRRNVPWILAAVVPAGCAGWASPYWPGVWWPGRVP